MPSEGFIQDLPDYHETESSTFSKRLVRSVSQKLKKKALRIDWHKEGNKRGASSGCLAMYGRGCSSKVGAESGDEGKESNNRRRSMSSKDNRFCIPSGQGVDCFSYQSKEIFRRNYSKDLEVKESPSIDGIETCLPDDILEMCLLRLPMRSLASAGLVCKKWRCLTASPRFMQMRRDGSHQTPLLFVFGCGEVFMFDVSYEECHRINADFLKGRFLFSTASIFDKIFVIGGRCSTTNSERGEGNSKTQKDVIVFYPLSKTWCKLVPMKHARSSPVVGICEAGSEFSNPRSWQERRCVNEDLQALSLTRQYGDNRRCSRQRCDTGIKRSEAFLLVVAGGFGSWDEPLYSAEIYDSRINKWIEIPSVPLDSGVLSSGVICDGVFYVYSDRGKLYGYDIGKGYWVRIQASLSPSRVSEFYPKLVSCQDRLFMLCVSWCEGEGEIGRRNKAIRKLWELDLVLLSWDEVGDHPDAPMDWNATFVGDRSSIFGVEVFRIFGQSLGFITVCDVSGRELRWNHISRNQKSLKFADPYMSKSVAVMHF